MLYEIVIKITYNNLGNVYEIYTDCNEIVGNDWRQISAFDTVKYRPAKKCGDKNYSIEHLLDLQLSDFCEMIHKIYELYLTKIMRETTYKMTHIKLDKITDKEYYSSDTLKIEGIPVHMYENDYHDIVLLKYSDVINKKIKMSDVLLNSAGELIEHDSYGNKLRKINLIIIK